MVSLFSRQCATYINARVKSQYAAALFGQLNRPRDDVLKVDRISPLMTPRTRRDKKAKIRSWKLDYAGAPESGINKGDMQYFTTGIHIHLSSVPPYGNTDTQKYLYNTTPILLHRDTVKPYSGAVAARSRACGRCINKHTHIVRGTRERTYEIARVPHAEQWPSRNRKGRRRNRGGFLFRAHVFHEKEACLHSRNGRPPCCARCENAVAERHTVNKKQACNGAES